MPTSPAATTRSVADLALLSDCQSAALVDRSGSVEWWCAPRFDSPSCFGRLLGADAGHWRIGPCAPNDVSRRYLPGTLVLESTLTTADGRMRTRDALAFAPGARGHEIGRDVPHALARVVECLDGEVELELDFAPRPDHGLVVPWLTACPSGARSAGGPVGVSLDSSVPLTVERTTAHARWRLSAGERSEFTARLGPTSSGAGALIADTTAGWESWADQHQDYEGAYREAVRHSALVLQALTYAPTGALVAAPTTSLPEVPGGADNWDYRYAWLRDASINLRALQIGACIDESDRYLRWIARAGSSCGLGHLPQVVFSVTGARDITEHELDHLEGFGGATPVRVGNAAWRQRQLDVPGEILDAAARQLEHEEIDPWLGRFLAGLGDAVADEWRRDDSGIWEGREGERPYTPSKVLAWVALDRAVQLAHRIGAGDRAGRWARERDAIEETVLEHAWSDELGAFAGALGSDRLDAGALLMPMYGFLEATDPRMRATLDVIRRELVDGPVVRRFTRSEEEGGFAVCAFWLVECLVLAGEDDAARELFEAALARANDVGLFAEIFAPDGSLRGNFPQAFVHAGLICAAAAIDGAEPSRRA